MRPGEEPIVEDDEPEVTDRARLSWPDPVTARTILRVAAIGALALWLLLVLSSTWLAWGQGSDGGFTMGTNRVTFTITNALSGSWGYLLVAVVAFATSMVLPEDHTAPRVDHDDPVGSGDDQQHQAPS